ncbi:MAG: PQQ-dependent dehydrogenase, methanol/ethanol family [Steroidobacteraceae bacterium]
MNWRSGLGVVAIALAGLGIAGAQTPSQASPTPAGEETRSTDWVGPGRTPSEQRFSPLKRINTTNVQGLSLAWHGDLHTFRGVEATPLVVDGVLYNVSAWDLTTAYDATNGTVLWSYDPKIPVEWSRLACCGPVSRGVAYADGKIFVGALDGRLIALDAKSGKEAWSTQTLDPGQPLSITGAPRVADGVVIIGNSGGDFGARGFVSAYDIHTGKQAWKFYIVPGDPAKPDGAASDSVMPMAAKTWKGEWWKVGGGGNAWDGIVVDSAAHRVFIATGNGSPHPSAFRSPGGGDNLFLCSVVALDSRTGQYAWHYQEVPGEEWDYDCTTAPVLADLNIDGNPRQVLLHAPKDGFFYVLDRTNGKLLSANNYVRNTWASHVDLATGRPVVNPSAHLSEVPKLLTPGYGGGHNWNPMAYSPLTGLAYFPAQIQWEVASRLAEGQFKYVRGQSTIGAAVSNYPELRKQLRVEAAEGEKGYLLAWNPVTQKEAFRVDYPFPGSGGVLVTAGNLLVQGTIKKTLAIYRADNGKKLWEAPTQSVPAAAPMSYEVRGKQYIAVNAGWNSAIVAKLSTPEKPFSFAEARLLVYSLDGHDKLPPAPKSAAIEPPPPQPQPAEAVKSGAVLYSTYCAICHGQNAVGGVKDLRYLSAQRHAEFFEIVLEGKLKKGGMQSFTDKLNHDQVAQIHSFLIARAQEDWQPDFTQPRRK